MPDDLLSQALREGAALAADPSALAARRKLPAYKLDPLVWVRERHVRIESKEHGLVQFDPYAFQKPVMRAVANWESFIVEKSRQMGVTTPIMVAYAHQLLYSHEVHGRPLHGCIVAHKLDNCIERILRIARVALMTAELTPEERAGLRGFDPDVKNPELSYSTSGAHNYLRAYSSEPGSVRSFDGNAALLEEMAFMPFPQDTYQAMAGMLTGTSMKQIVSTYARDGDFYCELVDDAEGRGLRVFSFDWRGVPERMGDDQGKAWREKMVSELGEEGFGREHELQRGNPGEKAVNMRLVREFEGKVPWLGPESRSGHRYSKGVDVAGPGEDSTAWVVVDKAVHPAQVVFSHGGSVMSTPDTISAIVALDLKYPGPMWIDISMNPAICAGVIAALHERGYPTSHITGIRFRRGGLDPTESFYRPDMMRTRNLPRMDMEGRLAHNLEHGRIVVHTEELRELKVALETWRRGENKRYRGRNIDYLDALLLANLVLTKLRDSSQTEGGSRIVGIPSRPELQQVTNRQW